MHLNNHSIITTWVETEADGDHINQYVDFKNNDGVSVLRKSDGTIFTVSSTISMTEQKTVYNKPYKNNCGLVLNQRLLRVCKQIKE